ncbi:MAG: periplasmic heavy metal sensor [Myxococcales bacterium]|nr:periplasmic heavy metal sensor [Myxococcales bacterium]
MIGFVFGAACLFGLIAMARRGRWHHGYGRGGFGHGPRRFLNRIFSRLETSPSQEKVIVSAVEDVRGAVFALRGEAEATRSEIARLLADESFDPERLGALFARHDDAIRQLREKLAGSMAQVHATLDGTQRASLARLIDEGPFWRRRHGGPYRQTVSI